MRTKLVLVAALGLTVAGQAQGQLSLSLSNHLAAPTLPHLTWAQPQAPPKFLDRDPAFPISLAPLFSPRAIAAPSPIFHAPAGIQAFASGPLGALVFNNRVAGVVDAPVKRPDGTGAGAGFSADLFLVSLNGVTENFSLFPSTPFKTSPAAAFYVNQRDVVIFGSHPGDLATLVMRAWQTARGSYENSFVSGQSDPFTITLAGGAAPPANLVGLKGFTMTGTIPPPPPPPSAPGALVFNNRVAGIVDAPIKRPDGSGAGAGFSADLFLLSLNGTEKNLLLTPTTTFRTSPGGATPYVRQQDVLVPGAKAGDTATLIMRAWETAKGSFEASGTSGKSAPFTITLGGGVMPPENLVGLKGFTMTGPPPPGALVFNNRVSGVVDAPVKRPDGTGAGAGFSADLVLLSLNGATKNQVLTPITTFKTSPSDATFYVNQQDVTIPGSKAGDTATLAMRAWETAKGSFEKSTTFGQSQPITITLGGGTTPPSNLIGLQGFTMSGPPPLGSVVFNNRVPAIGLDAPVKRFDGTGAGAGFTADLLLVTLNGETKNIVLTPNAAFNTSSPQDAFYVNPKTIEIPGSKEGDRATFVMRAWETSKGSFDASEVKGKSEPFTVTLGTTTLDGLKGFTMNEPPPPPEPGAGQLVFNNRVAGVVDAKVSRVDGTGAGTGMTAQLLLISLNGNVKNLLLTPTTTFKTSTPAGMYYLNQQDIVVPGSSPGDTASLMMLAFSTSAGSYEAAKAGLDTLWGESAPFTIILGGGSLPPSNLAGLQGFTLQGGVIVPEPSTLALAMLGAAGLLLKRSWLEPSAAR